MKINNMGAIDPKTVELRNWGWTDECELVVFIDAVIDYDDGTSYQFQQKGYVYPGLPTEYWWTP